MAAEEKIVLLTGGNSGLGFGIALELLKDPSTIVLLGCRSLDKGEVAVKSLLQGDAVGKVEFLLLDVGSEASIQAAQSKVQAEYGRIDALINNAAVGWPDGSLGEQMSQAFCTNATGPLLMVEAFLPLLQKSRGTPRVINVSSGAGSFSRRLDPNTGVHKLDLKSTPYCASKAALNYITATHAVQLGDLGLKVFAFSPGFVASNLGAHNTVENGAQLPEEPARALLKILNGERDNEHGGFLTSEGRYPW